MKKCDNCILLPHKIRLDSDNKLVPKPPFFKHGKFGDRIEIADGLNTIHSWCFVCKNDYSDKCLPCLNKVFNLSASPDVRG